MYIFYNWIIIQEGIQGIFINFIQVLVASRTNLFLFSSKQESLYNRASFLLSDKDLKLSDSEFTLIIRSVWWVGTTGA